jgi:membrane protein DedA with SNARE-associated domain
MESIIDWIQIHAPFIIHHKYIFIFIGATVESMNTIILSGFLASIGSVAFLPVLLICLAGEILNGYMWYLVGYLGGSKPIDRWGRKDPKSRKIIETVERYFHKYSGRSIVLAKLTWSLTIATMIMAGSFKYNLRKFSNYNFIGAIGWVAITFFIGYVFGRGYQSIFVITRIGYVILFFIAAVILIYILRHIFRSRFISSLSTMEHLREFGDKLKEGIDRFMSD